ncbi:MAG: hypothetical protein WD402_03340 [Chloroflexota bacterium]
MARAKRVQLLRRIERLRGSRVISYVTGDRQPVPAQIGDDAVRPMYELLREIGHVKRLDLFLYSRGGAIDVPWRLATALRQAADEWRVLIPFRANSAGTLLALGADQIVMGRQGELGPIDPIMNLQRMVQLPGGGSSLVQETVNVEDVMAYVRFVQDRGKLSDQAALSTALTKLLERIDAISLGNAYRTHSHIRDVARRLLLARASPPTEQEMATIVETLAERVYAHGHAIGSREAKDIGLPVEEAADDLDVLMWGLLNEYEDHLQLRSPIDPEAAVMSVDTYDEDVIIAALETTKSGSEFGGRFNVRAQRQMPPTLNVSLNLNLQLPGIDPQTLPPALQAALQQGQQALLQAAQQAVQEALRAQAPISGVQAAVRSAHWRSVT